MKRFFVRSRLALLLPFSALGAFALPGCGGDSSPEVAAEGDDWEVTPEQMARELGVTNRSGSRTVKPADFGKYPLVVDIFRRSSKNPPLGAFRPEYVPILGDPGLPPAEREADARRKFGELSAKEFAVISINGRPIKAQIISGALEGRAQGAYRTTPPGNYKLDIIAYNKSVKQPDGTTRTMPVHYPWLRSRTFNNSIMYWGLWMFGGYFIHSTTHYGELGRPASMGCIRQAYPDAIELFRMRQSYKGMIRVHPVGSQQAVDRLNAVAGPAWALPRLAQSAARIRDYIAYHGRDEVTSLGHAWIDPATGRPGRVDWPRCGPVDCFTIWGRTQPAPFLEDVPALDNNATEFDGNFIAL